MLSGKAHERELDDDAFEGWMTEIQEGLAEIQLESPAV